MAALARPRATRPPWSAAHRARHCRSRLRSQAGRWGRSRFRPRV